jgi:hypothetical protein
MRMKSCVTCKSQREEHRFLNAKEAAWLKDHLKTKNVDRYMVCLALLDDGVKQCRNVRRYFTPKPFKEPLRLPEQS